MSTRGFAAVVRHPANTPPIPRKLDYIESGRRRAKANATARKRCGEPVRHLNELAALSNAARSVYVAPWWGLMPAAFLMSMQARIVHRLISEGRVFRYNPMTTEAP